MKRRTSALAAVLLASLVAPAAAPSATANPFFSPSPLLFGAPQFDKIHDGDYQPAIEAGIAQELKEAATIANNPAPPTFDNTIVAFERSGEILRRVLPVFFGVIGANTDPTLQKIDATVEPKLAAASDQMNLNQKLFKRVATLYAKRASLHLDPESQQLLRLDYRQMVLAGAKLDPAQRAKMQQIDEKLATLTTTFNRQLLASTHAAALVVNSASALAGMSATSIAAAANDAKTHGEAGKWRIEIQHATQQPAFASLTDRSTRALLFQHSWNRVPKGSPNDDRSTIAQMAQLRAEKAALLGYPDFATYRLQTEMAKNPQTVQHFLHGLIGPTRAAVDARVAALSAIAKKYGQTAPLAPYDWRFYDQKLAKAQLDFDENDARPYLELHNVMKNGLFYAANQLYGITFKRRKDIPVYNPDVMVYEVYDKDGSPLALMYFDFFQRDNKQGGAWMSTFVDQSKLFGTHPVVYNVENIPKPAPGQPVLLTPSEVHGMFHEFGHALNAFFSNVKYGSLSGANTSRDFVEFPSQFNEHWAFYPSVLKHYAVNYKTGKPMPESLIKKMIAADNFDSAYSEGEALAADELDMAWHSRPASAGMVKNVDAFEAKAIADSGTDFKDVPVRYRSTYFEHIWSSGYAAGYYAYQWTAMLDDDAYQWFLDHGGLTRANGQRFRDMILSRGHSESEAKMFRDFYGHGPQVGPFLKDLGLTP